MDKILIAEDDFGQGIAALMAMKELGLDADLVCCANEAIEKIRQYNCYLAIITDMNMPIEKGGEINPKAGELVVSSCAGKITPTFVATAGVHEHHGKKKVIFIYFADNLLWEGEEGTIMEIGRVDGHKDVAGWRGVWKVIQETHNLVLDARKRYIKYVLKGERSND